MQNKRGRPPAKAKREWVPMSIRVPEKIHTALKIAAAKENVTMRDLIYQTLGKKFGGGEK
jgi:predicted HicB family RNase H-like nuclease